MDQRNKVLLIGALAGAAPTVVPLTPPPLAAFAPRPPAVRS